MGTQVSQRLFVALEVAEPARAALKRALAPLREQYPWLRWTDPETWHVTLAFVGRVAPDRVETVDRITAEVTADRQPLALRLDGRAGTFAGSVFFASLTEDPALTSVAQELAERLRAHGFRLDDRYFVAHCTLARVPKANRLPSPMLGGFEGPAVTWTARRAVVVRSRLHIGGVVHEVRSAHRFGSDPR